MMGSKAHHCKNMFIWYKLNEVSSWPTSHRLIHGLCRCVSVIPSVILPSYFLRPHGPFVGCCSFLLPMGRKSPHCFLWMICGVVRRTSTFLWSFKPPHCFLWMIWHMPNEVSICEDPPYFRHTFQRPQGYLWPAVLFPRG